jgi:hypothetical protein
MIRSLVRQAPRLLICVAMVAAVTVPAHGATITVPIQILDPSNACSSFTMGGTASQPTVTCNASGGGTPTAPSGCSLSGSAVAAGGGQTTLSVSCSSGGSPTSYAWTASPTPSSGWTTTTSAGSQAPTIAATTTFSVTPSNGVGSGNTASTTVTVSPGGGGGGGGSGGPISCPGATNTIVVDLDWNNPQRMLTGNIASTDAVVVRFTTGSSSASSSNITGAEFGGQQTARVGVLSNTACDFTTPPQLQWGSAFGSWGAAVYSTTVYMPFSIPTPNPGAYYPALAPNTTYYLNVKTTGGCSSCGMYFDLHH